MENNRTMYQRGYEDGGQEMIKRVVGNIKYILDFAESDKEMADNPEDPKVRINYFRDRLDEILDKLPDKE